MLTTRFIKKEGWDHWETYDYKTDFIIRLIEQYPGLFKGVLLYPTEITRDALMNGVVIIDELYLVFNKAKHKEGFNNLCEQPEYSDYITIVKKEPTPKDGHEIIHFPHTFITEVKPLPGKNETVGSCYRTLRNEFYQKTKFTNEEVGIKEM